MADYRALAQALDPYAMDTGGITPDTIKALKSGYKSPNLLGMIADIGRGGLSNLESLVRGGVAQFGGTPVDTLNTIRTPYPMEVMGDVNYAPDKQVYGGTKDILGMMPKRVTQARPETAGMEELGTVMGPGLAKAAMPAVRAGQKGLNLLGMEVADRLATGRSVLPSLLKEPQTAMFAVEPNPSMAMADESSAMRQQLTEKMQALLAQKKMATSAVDVGSINQQIGELQAQFKSLPAMGRVAREVVVPEITAPVSNLGFYSATEQAAINLERSKGTGQSFLNDLMNAPDVKNYEIEAMGLDTYLRGKPNVTRQEVQDFIAGNRVDVQEVRYGALTPEDQAQKDLLNNRNRQLTDQIATAKLRYEEGGIQYSELRKTISDISKERTGIEESLSSFQGEAPKFGQYQLPGGENYREILLTLPNKPMDAGMAAENYYTQFVKRGGEPEWAQLNPAKQQEITNAMPTQARNASAAPEYRSSHFNEPNILAHMRVNDRVDAEGKKMLLIEEVQSDWHQAGREKGYASEVNPAVQEYESIMKVIGDMPWVDVPETIKAKLSYLRPLVSKAPETVPDAPFKDTWHQLALKRAIKEAVDKGYDRIGLTTGAQQAARYDLSKQIDLIDYRRSSNNTFELGVVGKNGETVDLPKRFYTAEELPSVLGKEVADKIVKGEGQKGGGRTTLRGLDLQVGGEGMKKYYDEIYPNYLNKLGKKYGAQVGETYINANAKAQSKDQLAKELYGNNETYKNLPSEQKRKVDVMFMDMAKEEKIRYLDITPEMRKAIKEGQPLASIEEELAKALA